MFLVELVIVSVVMSALIVVMVIVVATLTFAWEFLMRLLLNRVMVVTPWIGRRSVVNVLSGYRC